MKDVNNLVCLVKYSCKSDQPLKRYGLTMATLEQVKRLGVSIDVITSQMNNSNFIYVGVYIYYNTHHAYHLCY